jgi:hypothetical protein
MVVGKASSVVVCLVDSITASDCTPKKNFAPRVDCTKFLGGLFFAVLDKAPLLTRR